MSVDSAITADSAIIFVRDVTLSYPLIIRQTAYSYSIFTNGMPVT